MQQDVWDVWEAAARDDDDQPPTYPGDFGFHYDPAYVVSRADIWQASNYVTLPAAGGYDDQDPLLMADFQTHFAGKRWARWAKDHPREAQQAIAEWQRQQQRRAEPQPKPAKENVARSVKDLLQW